MSYDHDWEGGGTGRVKNSRLTSFLLRIAHYIIVLQITLEPKYKQYITYNHRLSKKMSIIIMTMFMYLTLQILKRFIKI
jgi:hypothetical protein